MEHRREAKQETDRGKASDVVTLLAQKWQALSPEEKEVCKQEIVTLKSDLTLFS